VPTSGFIPPPPSGDEPQRPRKGWRRGAGRGARRGARGAQGAWDIAGTVPGSGCAVGCGEHWGCCVPSAELPSWGAALGRGQLGGQEGSALPSWFCTWKRCRSPGSRVVPPPHLPRWARAPMDRAALGDRGRCNPPPLRAAGQQCVQENCSPGGYSPPPQLFISPVRHPSTAGRATHPAAGATGRCPHHHPLPSPWAGDKSGRRRSSHRCRSLNAAALGRAELFQALPCGSASVSVLLWLCLTAAGVASPLAPILTPRQ